MNNRFISLELDRTDMKVKNYIKSMEIYDMSFFDSLTNGINIMNNGKKKIDNIISKIPFDDIEKIEQGIDIKNCVHMSVIRNICYGNNLNIEIYMISNNKVVKCKDIKAFDNPQFTVCMMMWGNDGHHMMEQYTNLYFLDNEEHSKYHKTNMYNRGLKYTPRQYTITDESTLIIKKKLYEKIKEITKKEMDDINNCIETDKLYEEYCENLCKNLSDLDKLKNTMREDLLKTYELLEKNIQSKQ
jgi:hypothetical protein